MNINESVYKNAKSTRPAWANALIVAGVILIAAVFFTIWSGIGAAALLYVAAAVAAVIAGILALTGINRAS